EGRNFTDSEVRGGSAVCIVGTTIKRDMFGDQSPIGQSLRIQKITCDIIGVLEAKGAAMFGGDQDETVVVPLRMLQRRLTRSTKINQIYVSADDTASLDDVKGQMDQIMRERRKIAPGQDEDFNIRDMTEVSNMMQTTTGILTTFLSAIAAISLLVGGIGI